jgi:RNase H
VGIILALKMLDTRPALRSVLIALDNQAVIQALQNNRTQPTQYLLDNVHVAILRLKRKHRRLHIHMEWVPGHMDIEGNEIADEHAKRAADGEVSNSNDLPDSLKKRLPASIAALRAKRKKSLMQHWRKIWSKSPRFTKMSQVDPNLPNRKILKLLSPLPRRASSILVQLRTGHVSLNAFLKKIKVSDTALAGSAANQRPSPTFSSTV